MKLIIVENPRPLTFEHYNDVANAPLSASLNSGYALAVARRAGWDSAYLDFSDATVAAADIAARILLEGGDLILFHWVYSWGHEALVCDVLDRLRLASDVPCGAFGLLPTLACRRLMAYAPLLDFILVGEFEPALAELLAGFSPGTMKLLAGVALRGEPFVPRPLLADLSLLPVPDDVGANLLYGGLNIAASRGCFGQCSFCFIKSYYGCSRRRVCSPASLAKELTQRLARRPVKQLYFIDPTFIAPDNQDRDRVVAISRLAREASLPFGFETRADTIDEALLKTLADNGAVSVFLGIESGCDSVLRRINKRITREQILRAVRLVQASGLTLNIGFIMFEPDSTLAELAANYALLEELGLLTTPELTVNLLYHNQIVLYGSAAWLHFEREGRLLQDERLPFEARYHFKHAAVGRICAAMGELAATYFLAMAAARHSATTGSNGSCQTSDTAPGASLNGSAVTALLKEAFCSFCRAAEASAADHHGHLAEQFSTRLQRLLTAAPP